MTPATSTPSTIPDHHADDDLVFVVDDDRGMRETVVEILDIAGIRAIGAGSASTARTMISELHPTLVVVDQRLPDSSGIDLGMELKTQDPDRPVLLLTGYATMENAIAAVGKVDDFLTKPIQPDQLVKAIRDGLEKYRLRQQNQHLVQQLQGVNAALETSILERTTELTGLVEMAEAIARSLGIAEVINASMQTMRRVSGSRSAALYLLSEEADDPNNATPKMFTTIGEPWRIPETFSWSFINDSIEHIESVDLQTGDRQAGIVLLRDPANANRTFLNTLATQVAMGIQNAQRFERERETVERLSELSRMENMFLASVSHELRTPLTAVIGFAQLLQARGEAFPDQQRIEIVDHIIEQGRALNRLVNDILDATRLESDSFTVELQSVQLNEVIQSSVGPFLESNHHVRVATAENLRPVLGDSERIEQVIRNLIQNALKYSPAETTISISAVQEAHGVAISVTDEGMGIEQTFLPHIFESFTRSSTAGDNTRSSGLGLGLYITKGLVDAMKGTIEVASEIGEGTTFVVHLKEWTADQDY